MTYAGADDVAHTVKLVGIDEADLSAGKINWLSPMARALMKAQAGDTVRLHGGSGVEQFDIIAVRYMVSNNERVKS